MSAPTALAPAALLSGAQHGFADGSSYDKHRPSYPPEAVDLLLQQLDLAGKQHARIVDLAAGTGKFTELLARRPDGYDIVAVEPHDGMRAELQAKRLANVKVVKGFATAIPLEDASADGLVCAQSFHWFATTEALTSIARVLKPHATLALIWNIEDYNNALHYASPHSWTHKLRELLFALDKESPADTPALRFRNETWRRVFDKHHGSAPESGGGGGGGGGKDATFPFSTPVVQREFPWTVWLDREALWNRFCTLSQIAAMPQGSEQLAGVQRLFDRALAAPDTETDAQGRIAVRGCTVLACTSKL